MTTGFFEGMEAKYANAPGSLMAIEWTLDCAEYRNLVALTGTPAEIRYGKEARSEYIARFDLFMRAMLEGAKSAVAAGKFTESQCVANLEKWFSLHDKIMQVPSAGWWVGMGTDFQGHPLDDTRKTGKVIQFYSQSA